MGTYKIEKLLIILTLPIPCSVQMSEHGANKRSMSVKANSSSFIELKKYHKLAKSKGTPFLDFKFLFLNKIVTIFLKI